MTRAEEIFESDMRWLTEAVENGWTLPPSAPVLRLPVVRWLRFVVASIHVHRRAAQWARLGVGIGGPSPYDRWVLWAIYRGWC